MDIWVNPTQENKIRKLGFNIPKSEEALDYFIYNNNLPKKN